MNSQREVVYTKRRNALYGERLGLDIANMMYDVCESLVTAHQEDSDFEGFKFDLIRTLSIEAPFDEAKFLKADANELIDIVYKLILETYKRKEHIIAETAYPVIKDVYEKAAAKYKNIVVPITDGTKTIQVITHLERAYQSEGRELVKAYQKSAILATIDEAWKEHLREMDDLKQSVQNATYEQKDPLLIYKFESFNLFKSMMNKVNREVVATLVKGHIPTQDPEQVREAEERRRQDYSKYQTSRTDDTSQGAERKPKASPVRKEKKVGRNDPCPCGSGKKYKNCHGKVQAE